MTGDYTENKQCTDDAQRRGGQWKRN